MTYVVIDLRLTYGLPSLGLSPLTIYKGCNMTSNTETQATKGRGQRGLRVTMTPESLAAHAQPTYIVNPESLDDQGEYQWMSLYQR